MQLRRWNDTDDLVDETEVRAPLATPRDGMRTETDAQWWDTRREAASY